MEQAFTLTDVQLWSIILGFLSPLIVAWAARPEMRPIFKILIQVVFSIVVAVVTAFLNGELEGRSVVSILLLVLASSTLSYRGLWRPTGVTDAIETGINGGSSDLSGADLPEADEVDPQDIR